MHSTRNTLVTRVLSGQQRPVTRLTRHTCHQNSYFQEICLSPQARFSVCALPRTRQMMPTPPPTGESFVFTAPTTQSPRGSNLFPGLTASGTTQVGTSKQIPYVNLREKVALQNIALEKLQAKVDAQEQAQKDTMERLMKDVIIVNNTQTNHLKTLIKAKMDSREQAQNEKIANLGAEVAHQNTLLANLDGCTLAHQKTVLQGLAGKVHSMEKLIQDITIVNNKKTLRSNTFFEELMAKMDAREQAQNEKIAKLGAEVAHQNTLLANLDGCTLAHQKTVLQGLAGKVHSIQHGMCAHFQRVLDDLATKVFNIEFYKIEPLTSDGGGTTRMNHRNIYLDGRCKVPNPVMMDIVKVAIVNTKMQEGPCTAVTRSECTHGPACQGGSFAHLT